MAASYNSGGAGGKPAIIPATDPYLTGAGVLTREPELAPRRKLYTIPGLSGQGSVYAGLMPVPIIWELTVEAPTITSLSSFEAKFDQYAAGGRYRLVSEFDDNRYWDYVEFQRLERLSMSRVVGGNRIVLVARVHFLWMQP